MGKKFGSVQSLVAGTYNKEKNTSNVSIQELDIEDIKENDLNTFSMNTDTPEFEVLVKSIERTGVLQPIVCILDENNKYIIIAGHRRYLASKQAGKVKIPAIVKKAYDKEENKLLDLVETNLATRKLTLSDITSSIDLIAKYVQDNNEHIEGRLNDYIGSILDLSGKQVERYKALGNLIPELKEKVENNEIGMSAVTQVASMRKSLQQEVLEEINKIEEETHKRVTRDQVAEIKEKVEELHMKEMVTVTNEDKERKRVNRDIRKHLNQFTTNIKQCKADEEIKAELNGLKNYVEARLAEFK